MERRMNRVPWIEQSEGTCAQSVPTNQSPYQSHTLSDIYGFRCLLRSPPVGVFSFAAVLPAWSLFGFRPTGRGRSFRVCLGQTTIYRYMCDIGAETDLLTARKSDHSAIFRGAVRTLSRSLAGGWLLFIIIKLILMIIN